MDTARPERTGWRPSKKLLAAVTIVAVGIGGAGFAYAVIPASNGQITGCYATTGTPLGRLRIIDPSTGAVCAAGEKQISWQQRGINFRGAYNAATAYQKNDAVTSGGNSYIALLANTGVPLTNTTNWAVLVQKGATGATGPRGPVGPSGPKSFTSGTSMTLVSGDNYKAVTGAFVAAANMSCLVTSSAQVSASTAVAAGGFNGFVRNADFANGGGGINDGQYGLYFTSNGVTGPQPVVTRSSVFPVAAGQSVAFGVYVGSPPTEWVGSTVILTTTYSCS